MKINRRMWALKKGRSFATKWGGGPYLFTTKRDAKMMSGRDEKPVKVRVIIEEVRP